MVGKGHPAASGTERKPLSTVPLLFSLDSSFFFRHTSLVSDALLVQGRQVTESNLNEIRALLARHPDWSRRRLSEALCEQWNWCNAAGRRKDIAARTLLLKLHQRGLIPLPARRQIPTNRMRARVLAPRVWDQTPYHCTLAELGPIEIQEVSRVASERKELAAALAEFHYLGSGGTVGENLQYTVREHRGRLLAGLLFGSAAWKCRERDQYIGWGEKERRAHLSCITNNHRFLIMPWVRISHLGSCILGRVLRRLSADWQSKYGHPIVLAETFVERDRFRGTVYQAANWQRVGETQGRTRQDRYYSLQVPIKEIYVYALKKNFRKVLLDEPR
jgi:hypothetical protein